MSRRDEREIRRRLADLPAGEPPPDLLARLQADLPPALAIDEEAAARRRPAALARWLLAASLAAMVGAGAVGLRVMRQMPPALSIPAPRATAASPPLSEPASALDRQLGPAGPSSARQLVRAGAEAGRSAPPLVPLQQAAVAPPAKQTLGDGVSASPATPAAPVPEPLPPSPKPLPKPSDMPQRLDAEEVARGAQGELAAPGSAEAPAAVAPARPAPPAVRAEAAPPAALMSRRQEAASLAGGKAKLENEIEEQLQVTAEAKVEAKMDAGIDRLARKAAGTAGVAPAARPLALWAPEVGELAADYDDDPVGTEGWTLAAGGTPPPPRIAGRPVSGPPAGARWVRFRVRAADAAIGPAATDTAQVEIDWNPRALADRRLLGGGRETGPADVFALSTDQLRRGWTIVYEVRLAPAATAGGERLATLRLRTTGAAGPPVRELGLAAAELAPTWQAAPAGLRLPCLAAAFAERRALGSRDGYADLLAAARDLAQTSPRGGRDGRRAASLLGRMARAERARPAGRP